MNREHVAGYLKKAPEASVLWPKCEPLQNAHPAMEAALFHRPAPVTVFRSQKHFSVLIVAFATGCKAAGCKQSKPIGTCNPMWHDLNCENHSVLKLRLARYRSAPPPAKAGRGTHSLLQFRRRFYEKCQIYQLQHQILRCYR